MPVDNASALWVSRHGFHYFSNHETARKPLLHTGFALKSTPREQRFHITNRAIHSRLWHPDLAMGVVGLTMKTEGHPRGNGDGPLTHPLEQTEQKG